MPPVNARLLNELRRYEDPGAGIYEEFAAERLGPASSFALLSGPLGEPRTTAFVICPSPGPEHGGVRRLEAVLARRLAAAGFAAVRIRREPGTEHAEIELETRLAEIDEAVALLPRESVGAAGVLFGATLAAVAAARHAFSLLALVQPVATGRQYARELLRREAVARMLAAGGDGAGGPADELETAGRTTIRGLPLSSAGVDSLSAVSLEESLAAAGAASLLVEISPAGAVSPALAQLAERAAAAGRDVTLEAIRDPLLAPLGEDYYRGAGLARVDSRLALDAKVAAAVTDWALARA
jgi:hypothetical protein